MTLRCIVPFCPKTGRGDPDQEEFICRAHWRRVDRATWRAYNAAHAKASAADRLPGPPDTPEKVEAYKAVTDLWERCTAQALASIHLAH
ncbi:hypothetical protein [Reyranella sp.]|uniref:hypothetical protein n=1 Tax=Reyranella sp. TaxID=1929291 RepID=UPI003D12C3F5